MTLLIRGTSLGNPQDAARIAIERGGQKAGNIVRYAVALWADCGTLGVRADCAFAQADEETGTFTSVRWTREGNPAGLGVKTGMPDSTPGTAGSPEWFARVHATHLAGYAGVTPPADWIAQDFRWQAMVDRGWFGVAETMQDLDERWAEDGPQQYGDAIEARWRRYGFGTMATPSGDGTGGAGKDTAMEYQAIRFVGLNEDVYLPADVTVTIDIVPDRFIGWVRSGQHFTGQTKTTFHDTGAPGQNARSQRNYLHNGPSEGGQRRLVGFNFAVDDHEIIQLTPLDEVTWAAGTPEGNRTSWHVEQCYGPGIDWDGSLRNAIALHAGLIAAKGWSTDTALVKHQHWFGKWCPAQVLNRGMWPSVVSRVSDAAFRAAAAANGGNIPPSEAPIYATPVRIPELEAYRDRPEGEIPYRVDGDGWVALAVFDRVRAVRDTPRLRYSVGDERVGANIAEGESFDVSWLLISTDFPDTYYSPWGTRIRAGDTQRVSDMVADAA